MDSYPFREIEPKWRERWEENQDHRVDLDSDKDKLYVLVMFSYPSEKKLHIGHWWNYGGTDCYARFKKMQGYNVFEPMGFDAFGLPAENYAVKHGIPPASTTRDSVNFIREQIKQVGAMYDWSREVDTSHPDYYKWTQWLFLQLFKDGAAYRKKAPVNWCSHCQTVLANEQVGSDGSCERCKTKVITRDLEQWFFRITDFADDLLEGLDRIDWPEATKTRQRHWIGRSEGTEIEFPIEGRSERIKAFTTRADTLFGVTYVVLAPEHPLTLQVATPERRSEVAAYISSAKKSSDIDRLSTTREKTGVFTGAYAINPANNRRVPIWTADYVLGTYGTGAVMAVPAHDQRDYEFSRKYDLPIVKVIRPSGLDEAISDDCAYEKYGVMFNSGQFDDLTSEIGKRAVTEWLDSRGFGRSTVSYRLRDWLISRQRYWGAPIPIIHCPKCGLVPVPEDQLPVLLPEGDIDYTPRGRSPLGAIEQFMAVNCPKCGGSARRDTDTMDTFVDSSWYFLRYLSTDCDDRPFDRERVNRWLPVDVYVGGPEHATGHLIYTRYIIKYLHSRGFIDFDEPAKKMVHQGIITYHGQRMSKSKGNVVNPDEFLDQYGSDCFRMYLMFMGDFTTGGEWSDESDKGISGIQRFQGRVWRLIRDWAPKVRTSGDGTETVDPNVNRVMHHTIKEVTHDLDHFQFNTAISRLMEFVNALYLYTNKPDTVDIDFLRQALETLTKLLGPLAPHMSEELWEILGHRDSLFEQTWVQFDETALESATVTVIVQVNGKLVERLKMPKDASQDEVFAEAMKSTKIRRHTDSKPIRKKIHIPNRILNLVV